MRFDACRVAWSPDKARAGGRFNLGRFAEVSLGWRVCEVSKITVGPDHFLLIDGKPVRRDIIAGGVPMPSPRFLCHHFTGGTDGDGDTNGDFVKDTSGAADVMRERKVSAHFVIDRDGSIVQCRPLNLTAGHAGGRTGKFTSIWKDPETGDLFDGNAKSFGIEFANGGNSEAAIAWAKRKMGAATIQARHPNGGPVEEWEVFPEIQIAAGIAVSVALVRHYGLVDVTGHDCIASWRKNDPGPAFPMARVREACGFPGLPRVFDRNGRVIKNGGATQASIPVPVRNLVVISDWLKSRDIKAEIKRVNGRLMVGGVWIETAVYDKEKMVTMADEAELAADIRGA
jgi:N-acetyl-anhydromuramyl-L-alanine amidase AmpD